MKKFLLVGLGVFFFLSSEKARGEDQALNHWISGQPPQAQPLLQDLRLQTQHFIARKQIRVLTFKQWIHNIPVENSSLRIIFKDAHPTKPLLVTSRLVTTLEGSTSLAPAPMHQIHESILKTGAEVGITSWKNLRTFYWIDPMSGSMKLLYERTGSNNSLVKAIAKSIRVDADTAEVYEIKDLILHLERSGNVRGGILPNLYPISSSNPGVWRNLADLSVQRLDSNHPINRFTAPSGSYSLSWEDSDTGLLRAQLNSSWTELRDQSGHLLAPEVFVRGSGIHNFDLGNDLLNEFTVAQTNTHYQLSEFRNWMRALGHEDLIPNLQVNTNINDECNAFYYDGSINFFRSSGYCVNTAYSTVIIHEVGHSIVEQLQIEQEGFGEGFSDALAMLFYNTPSVGQNFFGWEEPLRSPGTSFTQFPCMNFIHICGGTIAGIWWHIKSGLEAVEGPSGLEHASQLFFDWARLTSGGVWPNSVNPNTPTEILIADDDDANLRNGTPNWNIVCSALEAHGMTCPPLQLFRFDAPSSLPDVLEPLKAFKLSVRITPDQGREIPQSVKFIYAIDSDAAQSLVMTRKSGGVYEVTLPPIGCAHLLSYHFEMESLSQLKQHFPADGSFKEAIVAESVRPYGNFEVPSSGPGEWSVHNERLESGAWVFSPLTPDWVPWKDADGNMLSWMTGVMGEDHVGGYTELRSPQLTTRSQEFVVLKYFRWMGATWLQSFGRFQASACRDSGCQTLEDITGFFPHWTRKQFLIPTHSEPIQFRFRHEEYAYLLESKAAIDGIEVLQGRCQPPRAYDETDSATLNCLADFNGDGDVNVDDLLAFEAAYQSLSPTADLNQDSLINADDYSLFMRHYDEGC